MKASAALFDRISAPAAGVTVLIYHCVGGRTASAVDLPVGLFREQMAWLADSGCVISLDAAIQRLAVAGPSEAETSIVVTFDDGTADWSTTVMPILVELDVPATFYVATSFIEDQRPFPGGGRPDSWGGLADMVSTGLATIGSHTHRHVLLDRVDAATARDEVDRSAGMIEEKLGRQCQHFAYPKALVGSSEAQAEVRRRFASAALAAGRVNVAGSADLHRLWRTPIQRQDGMRWFKRKATGGLRLEGALRERVNRTRYADSIV